MGSIFNDFQSLKMLAHPCAKASLHTCRLSNSSLQAEERCDLTPKGSEARLGEWRETKPRSI
jgi:hypothetical protein